MNQLWISELEKISYKKSARIFIILIPFVVFLSSRYFLSNNEHISHSSPEYIVAHTFPMMGLSEQLMSLFNLILLIIVAFVFSEEYQTGQMRWLFQTHYRFWQIYVAKNISILATMALYLFIYFICCYLTGFLLFPPDYDIHLFFHHGPVSADKAFLYNLSYYGISFLTLTAMLSVFIFCSLICKTTTGTISTGIGFMLLSFALPFTIEISGVQSPLMALSAFTSVLHIQYQGIALMLAENPVLIGWNLTVLLTYIFIFQGISVLIFIKKDQFI